MSFSISLSQRNSAHYSWHMYSLLLCIIIEKLRPQWNHSQISVTNHPINLSHHLGRAVFRQWLFRGHPGLRHQLLLNQLFVQRLVCFNKYIIWPAINWDRWFFSSSVTSGDNSAFKTAKNILKASLIFCCCYKWWKL